MPCHIFFGKGQFKGRTILWNNSLEPTASRRLSSTVLQTQCMPLLFNDLYGQVAWTRRLLKQPFSWQRQISLIPLGSLNDIRMVAFNYSAVVKRLTARIADRKGLRQGSVPFRRVVRNEKSQLPWVMNAVEQSGEADLVTSAAYLRRWGRRFARPQRPATVPIRLSVCASAAQQATGTDHQVGKQAWPTSGGSPAGPFYAQ